MARPSVSLLNRSSRSASLGDQLLSARGGFRAARVDSGARRARAKRSRAPPVPRGDYLYGDLRTDARDSFVQRIGSFELGIASNRRRMLPIGRGRIDCDPVACRRGRAGRLLRVHPLSDVRPLPVHVCGFRKKPLLTDHGAVLRFCLLRASCRVRRAGRRKKPATRQGFALRGIPQQGSSMSSCSRCCTSIS